MSHSLSSSRAEVRRSIAIVRWESGQLVLGWLIVIVVSAVTILGVESKNGDSPIPF